MKDNKMLADSVNNFMNQQDTALEGITRIIKICKDNNLLDGKYKVTEKEISRLENYVKEMGFAVATAHHLADNMIAAYAAIQKEKEEKKAAAKKKKEAEKEVKKAPIQNEDDFDFSFDD